MGEVWREFAHRFVAFAAATIAVRPAAREATAAGR